MSIRTDHPGFRGGILTSLIIKSSICLHQIINGNKPIRLCQILYLVLFPLSYFFCCCPFSFFLSLHSARHKITVIIIWFHILYMLGCSSPRSRKAWLSIDLSLAIIAILFDYTFLLIRWFRIRFIPFTMYESRHRMPLALSLAPLYFFISFHVRAIINTRAYAS